MPREMTTERAVRAETGGGDVPALVAFPEGLIGLPAARQFAFERSDEIEPLLRMRSREPGDLSFLVVDPGLVLPGYRPRFTTEALSAVGLRADDACLVLAIACITSRVEDCTANLLAPLLINPSTMVGIQVILEPGAYSPRHPLVPPG